MAPLRRSGSHAARKRRRVDPTPSLSSGDDSSPPSRPSKPARRHNRNPNSKSKPLSPIGNQTRHHIQHQHHASFAPPSLKMPAVRVQRKFNVLIDDNSAIQPKKSRFRRLGGIVRRAFGGDSGESLAGHKRKRSIDDGDIEFADIEQLPPSSSESSQDDSEDEDFHPPEQADMSLDVRDTSILNADDILDPDDDWLIRAASQTVLCKKSKDKIIELLDLIRSFPDSDSNHVFDSLPDDLEDVAKETLVDYILSARIAAENAEEEALLEDSDTDIRNEYSHRSIMMGSPCSSTSSEAASCPSSAGTQRSPQQSKPPSTSSSISSSDIPLRGRSLSLPSLSQLCLEPTSREKKERLPMKTRLRATDRSQSLAVLNVGNTVKRTPSRLRNGKLRQKLQHVEEIDEDDQPLAQVVGINNHQRKFSTEVGEADDEGSDLASSSDDEPIAIQIAEPTPIAKRTRRHKRIAAGISSPNSKDSTGRPRLDRRAKPSAPMMDEIDSTSDDLDEDSDGMGESIADISAIQLRNGKKARRASRHSADAQDTISESGDADDEVVDLDHLESKHLLRLKRDELVKLCEERDLPIDGNKQDLVRQLVEWRDANESSDSDFEGPDSSSTIRSPPSSQSSILSDVTAKARSETKTQALRRLPNKSQSVPPTEPRPILLDADRSIEERPDTPPGSGDKEDDQLELDLESLNLLGKEIAPEKLKKGEKIGSGGFKDVFEGKYRNVKVAIADIRGHLTENDIKELSLLRDLRHDNIVRFIGVSIPEEVKDVPCTIITELCMNGDLFDYIRNVQPPPFLKMLNIMLGIAKGLHYLHSHHPAIIHRDMKSSNVLVTSKGIPKINDFGLARVKNSTRSMIRSLVGTVNWQAPELWVAHPRYNEKLDVYSTGLVFWECLQWHLPTKKYPFEGMNEHAIYAEVGQKQLRPPTATMRRQWGGDILDLVDRMWAQESKDRPSMLQVTHDLEAMIAAEKQRVRDAR